MSKTRDATQILDRMTGDDEALRQMIAEETVNAEVARLIYEARTAAGLTQAELAALIDTKQPVIARLEDADYDNLREHNFDEEDIWDIGAIAAFFALSNRMANLIGMRPNDQFYSMGRQSRETNS